MLGKALGVGASSISTWESATSPKLPAHPRLDEYATFFATSRSVEGTPRLLSENELTDGERAERDKLARELYRLLAMASGEAGPLESGALPSPWHFSDGGPVRIVCGKLPAAELLPYASAADHNYMQLSAYADLDAMVELFGHIRMLNPNSDVRYELAPRLADDDMQAHLVLLGGVGLNEATRLITQQVGLPTRQVPAPEIADGEVFEVDGDPVTYFGPSFVDDPPRLVEDVGLFVRTPNPANVSRTLTICSGVFTRGVYGAVRCLTDSPARFGNYEYLASRFGSARTFGLLMKVQVFDHATATPDLTNPDNRLHEWSEP
jgi:hypothetical protein